MEIHTIKRSKNNTEDPNWRNDTTPRLIINPQQLRQHGIGVRTNK
jgi:hypothetical protein